MRQTSGIMAQTPHSRSGALSEPPRADRRAISRSFLRGRFFELLEHFIIAPASAGFVAVSEWAAIGNNNPKIQREFVVAEYWGYIRIIPVVAVNTYPNNISWYVFLTRNNASRRSVFNRTSVLVGRNYIINKKRIVAEYSIWKRDDLLFAFHDKPRARLINYSRNGAVIFNDVSYNAHIFPVRVVFNSIVIKEARNCSRPFFLWDFGKVVWKFDWRIRS
jgi:hypothetical protein